GARRWRSRNPLCYPTRARRRALPAREAPPLGPRDPPSRLPGVRSRCATPARAGARPETTVWPSPAGSRGTLQIEQQPSHILPAKVERRRERMLLRDPFSASLAPHESSRQPRSPSLAAELRPFVEVVEFLHTGPRALHPRLRL